MHASTAWRRLNSLVLSACRLFPLRGLVDDALYLAAVDVELAGDGALAVAGGVPGPYRLLHVWCAGERGWHIAHRDGRGVAHLWGDGGWSADSAKKPVDQVARLGKDRRRQDQRVIAPGKPGPALSVVRVPTVGQRH
jgi:hypothetical protein